MSDKPIINIDEVEYTHWGDGGRFEAQLGPLAEPLGAEKLGYRMVMLPPGKTGWPYHSHHVNEEMFFILEGTGVLRFADKIYTVKPGDVISCPPGPQGPHQLTNTSATPMKYLAVSTREFPDICEYPDSDKIGVYMDVPDNAGPVNFMTKKSMEVSYWEDES